MVNASAVARPALLYEDIVVRAPDPSKMPL